MPMLVATATISAARAMQTSRYGPNEDPQGHEGQRHSPTHAIMLSMTSKPNLPIRSRR